MSAKLETVVKSRLNFKMCCVCLCTDRILYNMEQNELYKNYLEITDKNFTIDVSLRIICWECSTLLVKAVRFKTNALLSQTFILQYINCNEAEKITSDIDYYKNVLKSNLIKTVYKPNHTDCHYIYSEPVLTNGIDIPLVKLERDEINVDNDVIKDEENYFYELREYNEVDEENNMKVDEEMNVGKDEEMNVEENEVNNVVIAEKLIVRDYENNVGVKELIDMEKNEENRVKEKEIDWMKMNGSSLLDLNDENDTSSDETLLQIKFKKRKYIRKPKVVEKKIDRRKRPANEVLNAAIFEIIDLSHEKQLEEFKKRENSSNYSNSLLKCHKCFKGFVEADAFRNHMNRHTDKAGPFQCNICEIHFKKKRALNNHITSHMQKFCCLLCSYVTVRRHAAKMHEEFHKGTEYKCPHCFDEFRKKSTFLSHVRAKHPTDIICELCGYWFVSSKGLIQHKTLKHRFDDQSVPPDGPECVQCNVKFLNTEALGRHMRSSPKHITPKNGVIKIPTPRDRKTKITNKMSRRNVKQTKGPLQCEQCDVQLPDSLSYYRHFRSVHPDKNRTHYPTRTTRTYMCEICGKMFRSLSILQDHSTIHIEGKLFSCTLCNKSFQRKNRLIAHKRLHVHRARHPCTLCASVFTTASNLNRHKAAHSGLKPHKCEICDKSFKTASDKRYHIKHVHIKEPVKKRFRGKRKNKQNEPLSDDLT